MLSTLFSLGLNYSNYQVLNKINIFNFILSIIDLHEKEENNETVKKYLKLIRLHIGVSFYDEFLSYVRRKQADHIILRL